MQFVLCSSWFLSVQPRVGGLETLSCSVLGAAQAPQAPGTTTSASTALLGSFCSLQGTRGVKLPCHFSAPPPHHEQTGGK